MTHDINDDRDAAELIPHTPECKRKLLMHLRGGRVSCTCPARQGRRNYLYLIRRARKLAYIDAYALIRHRAKRRAEQTRSPQERQAFEEVAAWAEALELGELDGPEKS